MSQNQAVLTIDGVQYEVDKLSDKVKNLLSIYQKWEAEVLESKLTFAKNEAALRDLTREISEVVKAENQVQAKPEKKPRKSAKTN